MDLTSTGFFSLADRRLAWIDQSQQIRAENIANADTPGYRPLHIQPFSAVLDGAATMSVAETNARDLPGLPLSDQLAAPSVNGSASGAGVSVDNQLGKLADAEGMQNLVIRLYSAYLGMFRTALGA